MKKNNYLPLFQPYNVMWFALVVLVLSCVALGYQFVSGELSVPIIITSGIMCTLSLVSFVGLAFNPDSIRARQTNDMLRFSCETLACLKGGLNEKTAQQLCELLYPITEASSVVLCDREKILGYVGDDFPDLAQGNLVYSRPVKKSLFDGKVRTLWTPEELDLDPATVKVRAAIIVPLLVGRRVEGCLSFNFRSPHNLSSTQQSIAQGFAQLVSTQMAAEAMEKQQKLATSMELKALQSQINPHFLFNTINTIASLVRTDPMKARNLLREFAVFYRSVLDDSVALIPLSREIEQTLRYFNFEVARFGEERVEVVTKIEPEVESLLLPPFLIQPLVENSVQHAMPSEGKLTVEIGARLEDENMIVWVADDGVGMSEECRNNILHPESSTGIGIAVKNVHDRMCGYFGPGTHMDVESEIDKGTTITLYLNSAALREIDNEEQITEAFRAVK